MNKLELVDALKEENELNRTEAAVVVDMFFDEMSNALAKGDRVEIRGLCSFYAKKYNEYIGRNPKTGKTVKVKSKKLPFFKCGKELYKRVNH
jgi:integration host factor subunit beta